MQVQSFDDMPHNAGAWDAYVSRHEAATSDHLWGWRRVLSRAFGYRPYYLGAMDGDRLAGILPLFHIPRSMGRSALASIPFGNAGGVCADDALARQTLVDAAQVLADQLRAVHVDLRHRLPLADRRLQHQPLYRRFTMRLNQGDADTHLRRMRRDIRYDITRGLRLGLTMTTSRRTDQLYPIHVETFRRLGTPCFPRRYFELILQEFPQARVHLVAFHRQWIAFTILFTFKEQMMCLVNGSVTRSLRYRPNTALMWAAVQYGYAHGMTLLDYGRSRVDSGAAAFKRELGFTEEPLGYQYYLPDRAPMPQRNPSNPKYHLVIRVWRRLPLRLTRAVGPVIVRYLA